MSSALVPYTKSLWNFFIGFWIIAKNKPFVVNPILWSLQMNTATVIFEGQVKSLEVQHLASYYTKV